MHIILHAVLFYIHLILSIAPYLISGVAVYFYFQYQEVKKFNDEREEAIEAHVRQFGGSREDAVKAIYYDPFN